MSFLKAEWRKLALANYIIDPEILTPLLPAKTTLDLWQGNCYISLVGFMFKNVRLLGVPIPFHRNFEEVNLRFYVKYKEDNIWKRGVVFVKEIVPKTALTFVANTIYKEHYQTMPMKHHWLEKEDKLEVNYSWKMGEKWQSFTVETEKDQLVIEKDSETEFITEHYWGYTKIDDQTTFEYEVTHPSWKAYKIQNHNIQVDFGLTYGEKFSFLNKLQPSSVMLAEGSEITVEGKKKI